MTIQQILLKYWGYSQFRSLQEDIINSVLAGNDTLALMPTGGGKSICFQIPALAKEGICIVVTPLIALMKDQVENMKNKGIKAVAVTSGMNKREIDITLENCMYGDIKFLYLSPERLQTELAQVRIERMKVNLIAVDEAHCISQWGYDFRPSYLKIADIRQLHPSVPVLALTATATPEIAIDIQQKLLFKKENLLKKSFERKNLSYVVLQEEDKLNRLVKIANNVNGTGIVYVRSRRKTQEIAAFLNHNKITADYYHAGIESQQRDLKQERWIRNKFRVMVCTNAFGMGIDKHDVRFVVHMNLPDCIESYFQEAGRAGRDEKKAYSVLFYNDSDKIELMYNLQMSFPPLEEIRKTYQALSNYFQIPTGAGKGISFDFDINDFSSCYNLNLLITYNSIKFLEKEGYLAVTDAFYQPSKIRFTVNKEELYKFQVENQSRDDFIKLLLRSYSGIFDNYIRISESEIGRRIGMTIEDVRKILVELQKFGILEFFPQTEKSQIIFLQERIDAKDIQIAEENLKKRKAKSQERLNGILHYATEITKCRSKVLLSYFGETDSYRCGVCDICLERNKLELSNLEFENVSEQIKKLLSSDTLSLHELINLVKNTGDDKSITVVRWLIDTKKMIEAGNNKWKWAK
ncbi:MAG: ATP-dependent DNA helicase RecQ [Bacteroidota bacterium]